MEINLETIVFYVLLIDALGANLLVWTAGRAWWRSHMGIIARFLPLTKGWAACYLILVLVFGALLARNGLIAHPF